MEAHHPGENNAVLQLRCSVEGQQAPSIIEALRKLDGVRRIVRFADEARASAVILIADVEAVAADELVDVLAAADIASEDYVLARVDVVAPAPRHASITAGGGGGVAWIEVLSEARANSRPLARYLTMINVAAVIAALGVITANGILIVGAMAVSPDLLPICATCVGIVGRRPRLARRAALTLSLGLLSVTLTATVLAAALDLLGILPANFTIGTGGLGGLTTTDYSTVLIALAAGIAAMLSFETRASAAVGVAISVTTIPASAYLGVAIGTGQSGAAGALVVLLVNVALLIVSGSLTLVVQRDINGKPGGSRPPRRPGSSDRPG